MKTMIRLALAAALAVLAAPVLAATTTGTFNVTATVAAKCLTVSGTNLAFGAYDPTAAALTGTSTVSFSCTKTTPWKVTMTTGSNAGLGVGGTTRAMKSTTTGDYLSYDLYTIATYTAPNVWSSLTTGNVVSGTGTGGVTPNVVTVYGQIPAGQYVAPAADYTDSITFTVNY